MGQAGPQANGTVFPAGGHRFSCSGRRVRQLPPTPLSVCRVLDHCLWQL